LAALILPLSFQRRSGRLRSRLALELKVQHQLSKLPFLGAYRGKE
jgi:hypothetical protein